MTDRERAINQDLRVLDEAHRLGRITRAEYRARRRRILGALLQSSAIVTARKTLLPRDATTSPRVRGGQDTRAVADASAAATHSLTTLLSMRPAVAWKSLLALFGGALLIVLGCWLMWGR